MYYILALRKSKRIDGVNYRRHVSVDNKDVPVALRGQLFGNGEAEQT